MPDHDSDITAFTSALLAVDATAAKRIIGDARARSMSFHDIERIVTQSLADIGSGWERGGVALSQVYMSGRICEEIIDELFTELGAARINQPPMAIAVLEDYHLLGKRIVYSVLRSAGYSIADFGAGLSVDECVKRVIDEGIQILLISTLMLRSALRVRDVKTKLALSGAATRIVVGGAPFNFDPDLWREVGADAMGRTASDAVAIIEGMEG